jgi:CHAD domain-containing protein
MLAQDVLLSAFDDREKRFFACRRRCLDALTSKNVHDLRVACRRMLALLELLHAVNAQLRITSLRRRFKAHLRMLRTIRDLQMMQKLLPSVHPSDADVEVVVKELRREEKTARSKACEKMEEWKDGAVRRRLALVRAGLLVDLDDQRLCSHLANAIDERYAAAMQDMQNLDPNDDATIHRLRVAYKHLRYMIEIAQPLMAQGTTTLRASMDAFQQQMGNVQDIAVLTQWITIFAVKHPSVDVHSLLEHCAIHRTKMLTSFLNVLPTLSMFWTTTDHSLPEHRS